MKKLLFSMLLLLACTEAFSQESRKWDFNFSAAIPGNLAYVGAGEGLVTAIGEVFLTIFTFGLYKPGSGTYAKTDDHTWPALALQGGYQVYDWMQVTGEFYFHNGGADQFLKESDTLPARSYSLMRFSLLPGVKFTYLNKGIFHMYSSVAAGPAFRMKRVDKTDKNEDLTPLNQASFAFQATPVGFSVGGSVYGFLDTGIGSEYIGFRAGAGIRF